jgi:predicted PurR-regulated permease PerM
MLGIDQAILIGMVSGVASIIPYLGFVLGLVGAAIAAFIQFNELFYIVYVAVIFLIAQGVESMILTPWLVGDKIGLHPLAVIFSLMLGGFMFGLVGVLLALPFAAVAMVIIRHFHLIYVDSEIYLQREGAED